MATVSGSASTTTRNPRHWQLAVLVMATLPEIPNRARLFDHLVGAGKQQWRHFEAERPPAGVPRGLDDAGEPLVELANVRERDHGLARGQLQRSTGPVDAHRHGPRRVLVPPLLDARLFFN